MLARNINPHAPAHTHAQHTPTPPCTPTQVRFLLDDVCDASGGGGGDGGDTDTDTRCKKSTVDARDLVQRSEVAQLRELVAGLRQALDGKAGFAEFEALQASNVALKERVGELETKVAALENACGPGEFEASPATNTTAAVCKGIAACAKGEFQLAPPTATSDRKCGAEPGCADDRYYNTLDQRCEPRTVCAPPATFVLVKGTPTADTVCAKTHPCQAGFEYRVKEPTLTTDRR